ncbi:MAG TPA: 3-hydroxyacyl-CoA dehydrogenase family protein [bacterium]|nr:3-hydroxyacyl-CoA dehydrogenase family protein [bacterium]
MSATITAPSEAAAMHIDDIKTVGVVGCGTMGSGIVQVIADAGYNVVVREVTQEYCEAGRNRIDRFLSGAVAKGKKTQEDKDALMGRLAFVTELAELIDCDLVVEAMIENLQLKNEMWAQLDQICKPGAIFATNTSSLSVTEQAASTKRPSQFVGMHFFNPVPLMKLVEIVRGLQTSDATMETGLEFGRRIGKEVVACKDTPGFVVNLLLVPYLNDAARAYEAGVASAEDIDKAMRYGAGYPMGPLRLLDEIGLDVACYVGEILYDAFKDVKYSAPPILYRMVKAGYLGRKSGRGFYEYGQ